MTWFRQFGPETGIPEVKRIHFNTRSTSKRFQCKRFRFQLPPKAAKHFRPHQLFRIVYTCAQ